MTSLKALQKKLSGLKIDCLFVTNPTSIFYLTGFIGLSPNEREALVFVDSKKCTLLTARLYENEAKKLESSTLLVQIAAERDQYIKLIKEALAPHKRIGFESLDLRYEEYKKFSKYASVHRLKPKKEIIEKLREIKNKDELESIKKAQIITQEVFDSLLKVLKVGMTEEEISDKIKKLILSLGAGGTSFDPIVASGPNSALPHYFTGKRKLRKGDTLLTDYGAKLNGYCADFSRTVFIGKASDEQRNVYNHVESAQRKGFKATKGGIKAKVVAKTVNDYFKAEKLYDYFIHSLGHGIGLDVHEAPSLSIKSKDILANNMVFSIEPGLYFPWGGIRIEDLFYVENNKPKIIGNFSKFTIV